MEANLMKLILAIAYLCITTSAQAALKKNQDELARYRSEVINLGARLNTLEKELNSKNNLHHSSLAQIKQFEADINLYKEALQKKQNEVFQTELENKKIIHSYVIEMENDSGELWQKKIHFELIKKAQQKLNAKKIELKSFEDKVVQFDEKLADLRKNEEELVAVIAELENRKKIAMQNYLVKVEARKKVESKFEGQKIKQRVDIVKKQLSQAPIQLSKPERLFINPIEDFIGINSSQKGVTFKLKSIQPIKAVGDGRVVFAGELASYGQVVLIDHGNDLRTVLLGRMSIKVKKNDFVKIGDLLGYTMDDTQNAQSLYFEVRKKNTAQNTILWLEPQGASKI